MTEVKITKKDNKIIKVECKGHTEFGTRGEDIVCAALSSIVQTAALGLLTVAEVNINLKRDEKKGHLLMEIPQNLKELEQIKADAILETMLLGVGDLHESYSDFIAIEIVK